MDVDALVLGTPWSGECDEAASIEGGAHAARGGGRVLDVDARRPGTLVVAALAQDARRGDATPHARESGTEAVDKGRAFIDVNSKSHLACKSTTLTCPPRFPPHPYP